jgi:hypothetical protein
MLLQVEAADQWTDLAGRHDVAQQQMGLMQEQLATHIFEVY